MRAKWIPFLLLAVGLAFGQETQQGEQDRIAQDVQKKILSNDKIHIDQLKVLHQDDSIYLEGIAELYGSRYLAGEYAAKAEGIKKVDNQIAVKAGDVSDLEIQGKLLDRIFSHLRPEPFDLVSLKVNHGFVTLTGYVRDVTLIDDAFREAIWTPGVRDVQNKIQPASVGAGDERLRRAIFVRVSREYPQYFSGRYPSFVILVDYGHVRLVGYVDSAADKLKIGSMIRSLVGVLSVDNDLETK